MVWKLFHIIMTGNTILFKFFKVPLKSASKGDFKVYILAAGKVLNLPLSWGVHAVYIRLLQLILDFYSLYLKVL